MRYEDLVANELAAQARALKARHDAERAHANYVVANGSGPLHLKEKIVETKATLRLWKARSDVSEAEHDLDYYDVVLVQQGSTALVRMREAEAECERYARKAEAARAEAARHFAEAMEAAMIREKIRLLTRRDLPRVN